jgi:SAM-dependent methyltransferase
MASPPPEYLFDRAEHSEELKRLRAVERAFDPGTRRHLAALGLKKGWHCLEVGAGAGSIAVWMSRRVGPDGRVIATDINPRFLDSLAIPNLEVRKHDILADELDQSFDLIHARAVLEHLPKFHLALDRMVAALKPGGWLLIEDNDYALANPAWKFGSRLFMRARHANLKFTESVGLDVYFGSQIYPALRDRGLVSLGSEARSTLAVGRTHEVDVYRMSMLRIRAPVLSAGLISAEDYDPAIALFDNPKFGIWLSMVAGWGRKVPT